MLQRRVLSIKSGCYNEHRCYNEEFLSIKRFFINKIRMLQRRVFINKIRMVQRTVFKIKSECYNEHRCYNE